MKLTYFATKRTFVYLFFILIVGCGGNIKKSSYIALPTFPKESILPYSENLPNIDGLPIYRARLEQNEHCKMYRDNVVTFNSMAILSNTKFVRDLELNFYQTNRHYKKIKIWYAQLSSKYEELETAKISTTDASRYAEANRLQTNIRQRIDILLKDIRDLKDTESKHISGIVNSKLASIDFNQLLEGRNILLENRFIQPLTETCPKILDLTDRMIAYLNKNQISDHNK